MGLPARRHAQAGVRRQPAGRQLSAPAQVDAAGPRRTAARKVLEAAAAVGGAERDGRREGVQAVGRARGGGAPRAGDGHGDDVGARRDWRHQLGRDVAGGPADGDGRHDGARPAGDPRGRAVAQAGRQAAARAERRRGAAARVPRRRGGGGGARAAPHALSDGRRRRGLRLGLGDRHAHGGRADVREALQRAVRVHGGPGRPLHPRNGALVAVASLSRRAHRRLGRRGVGAVPVPRRLGGGARQLDPRPGGVRGRQVAERGGRAAGGVQAQRRGAAARAV